MTFFSPQPKTKIIRLEGKAKDDLQVYVLERDSYCCRRCGIYTEAPPHHIVLVSRGGSDDESNMVSLCIDCHAGCHRLAYIVCYGTSDDLVFSLTLAGKMAVKHGKLRGAK